jgi:hypothetical protein
LQIAAKKMHIAESKTDGYTPVELNTGANFESNIRQIFDRQAAAPFWQLGINK